MRHIKEFNRFAKSYHEYNIIQREVAEELVSLVSNKPKKIIDLGCGSGTLYESIDWKIEKYLAIDLSEKMLTLHPKDEKIESIHADFDDPYLYNQLKSRKGEYLISSSSLQWSADLATVFKGIRSLDIPFALALFTSGTFKTIHETAGITPPLRSAKEVIALAEKYLGGTTKTKSYRLDFDSKKEMFAYIKKSGVSGAKRHLGFMATKNLMNEYPLDYLEFEVVFITQ